MVGWKGDLQPWGSRLGHELNHLGFKKNPTINLNSHVTPKKPGMTALSRMKCCIQLTHQFMLSEVAIPEHQL